MRSNETCGTCIHWKFQRPLNIDRQEMLGVCRERQPDEPMVLAHYRACGEWKAQDTARARMLQAADG